MRDNQIIARKKRRKIRPRLMTAETMAAPNILARDFLPSAPNEFWASDITYLRRIKKSRYRLYCGVL